MTSSERALLAVRAQVQFELAQIGAEVAQAATLSARAQSKVSASMQSCESVARELRSVVQSPQINPALFGTLRRLYQVERGALRDSQAQLTLARQREQEARTTLAGVRNRERAVDRALQAERRKQQLKQQALEIVLADDLWLQQAWREQSS